MTETDMVCWFRDEPWNERFSKERTRKNVAAQGSVIDLAPTLQRVAFPTRAQRVPQSLFSKPVEHQ